MPLWPHQQRAIDLARARYAEGSRRILIVMPTGSGKTVVASTISKTASRSMDVLWIVHRRELVHQAEETLGPGFVVRTVQGMLATGERPPAGCIVIDEAHRFLADEWYGVAQDYDDALLFGFTATPSRSDDRGLGDLFDSMVVGATYSELIRGGYLVPCVTYSPKRRGGLAMPVDEAIQAYASDKQSITFCDLVSSAEEAQSRVNGAAVISGTTPSDERDRIIRQFREGQIQHLINCFVLVEGFDAPNAEVCILARGASHATPYIQMAGRVLRSAPGKKRAVLVDLVGAVHEHGPPDADREYSLAGDPIRQKKAEPLWSCRSCGFVRANPPSDRKCPFCDSVMDEPEAIRVERRRIERQEYFSTFDDSKKRETWRALVAKGKAMGRKPGWAAYVFKSRFNHWPPRAWGR